MILKAIDLSLMSEHLSVHKGVLPKLKTYYCHTKDPQLKQTIYEQFVIMKNHVKVMLSLIDDRINETITVASLNDIEPVTINCNPSTIEMSEEEIALELRNTAKTMAHDNLSSALRMKADNVRDIHLHMAFQQFILQHRYNQVVKRLQQLEVAPDSSLEEQRKILNNFKRIYNL
ncbi:hypothetical protein [Bacillus sp. AK128]